MTKVEKSYHIIQNEIINICSFLVEYFETMTRNKIANMLTISSKIKWSIKEKKKLDHDFQ